MTEVWRVQAIVIYNKLKDAQNELQQFSDEFILKTGDARNILINNTSKYKVINIKKFIDFFLIELEKFQKSIRDNLKVCEILESICSSKNIIKNDLSLRVKCFLSIFDGPGIPGAGDIHQIIQTFRDFIECYTLPVLLLTL